MLLPMLIIGSLMAANGFSQSTIRNQQKTISEYEAVIHQYEAVTAKLQAVNAQNVLNVKSCMQVMHKWESIANSCISSLDSIAPKAPKP